MRGRQKDRAIEAEEKKGSIGAQPSLRRIGSQGPPSSLGHHSDLDKDDSHDRALDDLPSNPPLRAEASSYNAAALIASSSLASGVGRLLDERFDIIKEISMPGENQLSYSLHTFVHTFFHHDGLLFTPIHTFFHHDGLLFTPYFIMMDCYSHLFTPSDLAALSGKKSKSSALARSEMELLEAELSVGKKKKDKKDRAGGLASRNSTHSPLERSPSNSRRGSINGSVAGARSPSPSPGLLGFEASDPSLSLPSPLRNHLGGKGKGRQAHSHLSSDSRSTDYSSSVAAAAQAATANRAGSASAAGQGRGQRNDLLQNRLSGHGGKPSSSLPLPPHPTRRASSQSPLPGVQPHGVVDPNEIFPERPGTVGSRWV